MYQNRLLNPTQSIHIVLGHYKCASFSITESVRLLEERGLP